MEYRDFKANEFKLSIYNDNGHTKIPKAVMKEYKLKAGDELVVFPKGMIRYISGDKFTEKLLEAKMKGKK